MIVYLRPKINTISAVDLEEYLGLQCNGYVTMQSGRTSMLKEPLYQQKIVVCKTVSEKEIKPANIYSC